MNRWWKRGLSLLLAFAMILGIMPVGLRVNAAADNLGDAEGIIWLTKNEAGDSASEEFVDMVEGFKLGAMIRDALGVTDNKVKVLYEGLDVEDAWSAVQNQAKYEAMGEELKAAVSEHELVRFVVGGRPVDIAFRSIDGVTIVVGDNNKIYVDSEGKPDDIKALVEDALNKATVNVIHNGTVSNVGVFTEDNLARYEGAAVKDMDGWDYSWPTLEDGSEKTIGQVSVSVSAVDTGTEKSVTADVILRDTREKATVTYVGVAYNGENEEVVYEELGSVTVYVGDPTPAFEPTLKYYDFVEWETEFAETVTENVTYRAKMKAQVDDADQNGVADQNQKFTVTYMLDEKTVYETFSDQSYGVTTPKPKNNPTPPTTNVNFNGWKKQDGGAVDQKVVKDAVYVATWTEGPTASFQVKYLGEAGSSENLYVYLANTQTNIYKVEDPGTMDTVIADWEAKGYQCTGWYYVDASSSNAQDLNKDGVVEEVPFDFETSELAAGSGHLKLYVEFFYMGENDECAAGTRQNPVYIYNFVDEGGEFITQIEVVQKEHAAPANAPAYTPDSKYEKFVGWTYTFVETKNNGGVYVYTAVPDIVTIQNTVAPGVGGIYEGVFEFKQEHIAGTNKMMVTTDDIPGDNIDYRGEVEITGLNSENGVINYTFNTNTEFTISPLWKYEDGQKTDEMGFYVESVTVDDESVITEYDSDYNACRRVSSVAMMSNADVVSGAELQIKYGVAQMQFANGTLAAGQDDYTEEDVYTAFADSDFTYNDSNVTVRYLAREGEIVTVNLYKLYEALDAEGVGFIKATVKEAFGDYKTFTLSEKWLDVTEMPEEDWTAQEVADDFIAGVIQGLKDAHFSRDAINALPGAIQVDLKAELNAKVVHKFGYVTPGKESVAEGVEVTYKNDKVYTTLKSDAFTIKDNRIPTTLTVNADAISVNYADDVAGKLLGNVVLTADDDADLSGEVLTTNGRDFSTASAGGYDVAVVFDGNETYRPAKSETFRLTVNKVTPTITVKGMVAVNEGSDYYSDVIPVVSPEAPIAQITAGVSMEELDLDEDLALVDGTVVIDVWAKLPEMYTSLLNGLNLSNLPIEGIKLPNETIELGTFYNKEQLDTYLREYVQTEGANGGELIKQVLDFMDRIPEIVPEKLGLGLDEVTYRIRLDTLGQKIYPTAPGFYLNYAATLSSFIEDANYGVAEEYGFIAISPMIAIPNRGGIQLYDGTPSNAQNVFEYAYNGVKTVRDLEVALDGVKLEGAEASYIGLTAGFTKVYEAPTVPGVYVAYYNYTTDVFNEDTQKTETRLLGSDSAIIVIKPREADLTITGGTYEYDAESHLPEIKVTDKSGNAINGAGVTVISGTVNADYEGTNVSAGDLYGAVNIDFPEALQDKWDAYCQEKWGTNAPNKITPSDVIDFLDLCGEKAVEKANAAAEDLKELAVHETVQKVLDKINSEHITSDNLINKTERVQDLMNGGKAYYDELIRRLLPLKNLDDNVWVTFYDLKTETAKLDYDKTGAYLYMGVITDPELTIGAATGVVLIHSEDDYIMHDTHVPYDGNPHDIFIEDTTSRSDVTVVLDRQDDGMVAVDANKKVVHIQVDAELAELICNELNQIYDFVQSPELERIPGFDQLPDIDLSINSGFYVGTVYSKTGSIADRLTAKIINTVKNRAIAKITADYPNAGAALDNALNILDAKMDTLTDRLLAKFQELDKLDNGTYFVINSKLPVDLGSYEITTFDFNIKQANIQLDEDTFNFVKKALEEKGYALNKGSDGYVVTGYQKGENVAEYITDKIFEKITEQAEALFDRTAYETPEMLTKALEAMNKKLLDWEARLSAKVQDLDNLDDYTRIVINGELPTEVGTYEFYGFDYDVAATRGKLVIEPIYIVVKPVSESKFFGEEDPVLTAEVSYYSYDGIAPATKELVEITKLPNGLTQDDLLTDIVVTREAGEDVNKYDMFATATLIDESGNYVLTEYVEDPEDERVFEILPLEVNVTAKVEPDTITVGETAELTITVTDKDGNEISALETTYVINGDPNLTFEDAVATVGEYTIVPGLVDAGENYTVVNVTEATLTVETVKVNVTATVDPTTITVGETAELTVTVTDMDGNVVDNVETTYVIDGDPNLTFEDAVATVGVHTIVPSLVDAGENYTVVNITEATLTVEEEAAPVEVNIIATVYPNTITVGETAGLSITVTDMDGNEITGLETTYEIEDSDLTFEQAMATVGVYTIVPKLAEGVEGYDVVNVTTAALIVKEAVTIPVLECRASIYPSTVTIGTLTADDIEVTVTFKDNLGTDANKLYQDYFDYYDVQTAGGYTVEDYNGDGVRDLNDALTKAGTYYIVPMYKGNPEATYADDTLIKASLVVREPSTPGDPSEPNYKEYIDIWVSLDKSSVISGKETADTINPQLNVMVSGKTLTPDNELYKLLNPSYQLVDDKNNPVNLEDALNNAGTYRFVISYNNVDGYEISAITKRLTVSDLQLNVSATVIRNGAVTRKVGVGLDASELEVVFDARDNNGSSSADLIQEYIDGYVITDASSSTYTLQEALNRVGTYTIKPIVVGNPEEVYGDCTIYSTTLNVARKTIRVYPTVKYNGTEYTRDEIAYGHNAELSTGYKFEADSFWAEDEKLSDLIPEITVDVTWTPEVALGEILNNLGTYTFKANGTTTLDENEYEIVWGTRVLQVTQIGAQARIRPIANSIFQTVSEEEATYKLQGKYEPAEILANLSLSVSDDHGNAADSGLIAGLKVTQLDGPAVATMSLGNTDTLYELSKLQNSGRYLIETVISDDIGDYYEVLPDSITVVVDNSIGTVGLGEWKMNLDSVVYLHYYPKLAGFDPDYDFSDPDSAGVVIWTGDKAPSSRNEVVATNTENTMVIKGWRQTAEGEWYVRTHEIYAKNLGDMVYIRPYVVNDEGEYVYLNGAPYYSPKLFAYDVMSEEGRVEEEKYVCAALLQYGASAQIYFDYDVDNLVTTIPENFEKVKWADYDLEYNSEYRDSIVIDDHVRALAATLAIGEHNKQGVEYVKSALSLVGAIRFNVGFNIDTSKIDLDKIVKKEVLFWNERDFAKIDSLEYKYHNYSFIWEDLTPATGNEEVYIGDYRAQSDHIVAKYLGESVYFTCRIEMEDGTVYNSGLGYYSPEAFAGDHIDESTGQIVEVSKRIIVYSEMAKRCFLGND